MTSLLVAVSLAAWAGTPHCLGMCGGLATAASEGGMLPYQTGRIGIYAALGGIAGAMGVWIPGPSWVSTALSALLIVGMSASLAGWVPEPRVSIPGLGALARRLPSQPGPAASFSLGILNGLLPCGLLYATLALPVASGSPWKGAALMVVFGLWSAIPLTLAARGLRKVLVRPGARKVLAGLVLSTGLLGLSWRAPALEGAHSAPPCHTPPPDTIRKIP